jgi:hypothetical protein
MDGRHHGDVDIAPASPFDPFGRAQLRLRRAGIAVEKERAFGKSWQRRDRGFVRLIGGDDGKYRLRAGDGFGRARGAEHVRCDIIGSLRGSHFGVG